LEDYVGEKRWQEKQELQIKLQEIAEGRKIAMVDKACFIREMLNLKRVVAGKYK